MKKTVYNRLVVVEFILFFVFVLLGLYLIGFCYTRMTVGAEVVVVLAIIGSVVADVKVWLEVRERRVKFNEFKFYFDDIDPTLPYQGMGLDNIKALLLEAKDVVDSNPGNKLVIKIFKIMEGLCEYWGFNTDLGRNI